MYAKKAGYLILLCLSLVHCTGIYGAAQPSESPLAHAQKEGFSAADEARLEKLCDLGGPAFAGAFYPVFSYLARSSSPQECMKLFSRFERCKQVEWRKLKQLFTLLNTDFRARFLFQMVVCEEDEFNAQIKELDMFLEQLEGEREQQEIIREYHEATTYSAAGKIALLLLGFHQGYVNTILNKKGAAAPVAGSDDTPYALPADRVPLKNRALANASPVLKYANEIKYLAKNIRDIVQFYAIKDQLPVKEANKHERMILFWATSIAPLFQEQIFDLGSQLTNYDMGPLRKVDVRVDMHTYDKVIEQAVQGSTVIPEFLKDGVAHVSTAALFDLAPAALYNYQQRKSHVPGSKDSRGEDIPEPEELQKDPRWKYAIHDIGYRAVYSGALAPLWQKLSHMLGREQMSQLENYTLGLASHDLARFASTMLVKSVLFGGCGGHEFIKKYVADFSEADKAYLRLYKGQAGRSVYADNHAQYLLFQAKRYAIHRVTAFCVTHLLEQGKDVIVGSVNGIGSVVAGCMKYVMPEKWVAAIQGMTKGTVNAAGLVLRIGWRMLTAATYYNNMRSGNIAEYLQTLPESFLERRAHQGFAKKIASCLVASGYNHFDRIDGKDDMRVRWKRLIGWGILWYLYSNAETKNIFAELTAMAGE